MSNLMQIAAVLLPFTALQPGSPAKPLRLHVERQGEATVIRIDGLSTVASSVPYDLQVTNGDNRSRPRRVAHLRPGVRSTVATVRLVSKGGVLAELDVGPGADPAYREEFRAPR